MDVFESLRKKPIKAFLLDDWLRSPYSVQSSAGGANLSVPLGVTVDGEVLVHDLFDSGACMEIRGGYGFGKSVLLNSCLTTLVRNNTPDDLVLLTVNSKIGPSHEWLAYSNHVQAVISPELVKLGEGHDRLKLGFHHVLLRLAGEIRRRAMMGDVGNLPAVVLVVDDLEYFISTSCGGDAFPLADEIRDTLGWISQRGPEVGCWTISIASTSGVMPGCAQSDNSVTIVDFGVKYDGLYLAELRRAGRSGSARFRSFVSGSGFHFRAEVSDRLNPRYIRPRPLRGWSQEYWRVMGTTDIGSGTLMDCEWGVQSDSDDGGAPDFEW